MQLMQLMRYLARYNEQRFNKIGINLICILCRVSWCSSLIYSKKILQTYRNVLMK
ncbi:hypothetical protein PSECIP111854_02587 [Pseudoalteromonas sp. CIP111854]|uniref:Uncharacterized protein n=1 Tax=Pseudoalteromonas holothuriae TaxID=2963714 RepID=A0A9W4QZN9_9GAMM|nr:hypothetical protein PSECIP111854_02587 [Pseudoalteromonas sp. CIP111854]